MLTRRAFSLSVVTLGLLAATGTAGCEKKTDDLVVGAFLSLSGSDATFGEDTKEGIELAVEELNKAGGIKNKKVRVLYEDDKSQPQEASNKVRQLIDRDNVLAILGEVASSRTMAGGLIANTKKVPLITPSSTAVEVTKDRDYVFRVCFTDDQQGDVAARFVWETLKKKKAGLFYAAQDNYSSGLANSFKDHFKKLGGEIVVDKGYQKNETNFTTYLSELKSKEPEIIFVPVYYNEMVQIARQAKQAGIPGTMFVGGDGWDSHELLDGAGAELEGAYFTNHYAPDVPWPNSASFVAAYKAKYTYKGKPKEPTSLSAQGYDAAKLLFDAMKRTPEVTRENIKTALADTKDFAGATGSLTIDKAHNANKPIVVVQVKGGAFKYTAQLMSK